MASAESILDTADVSPLSIHNGTDTDTLRNVGHQLHTDTLHYRAVYKPHVSCAL
jgi:hypothetical protein